MMKAFKRFLAVSCVAALLLTVPGISVLAEELKAEEAVSDAGENKEAEPVLSEESVQEHSDENVVSEMDVSSDLSVVFDETVDEDSVEEVVNQTS